IFNGSVFVSHHGYERDTRYEKRKPHSNLKSKDGRKLRSNVVRGKARNSAKQGQQSSAEISACPVVTLLITKRHPLVPLVLNVAREEIAAIATRAESSRVARHHLIVAVVEESSPAGIASCGIGIEDSRQRKADLNETALGAHWSLGCNLSDAI